MLGAVCGFCLHQEGLEWMSLEPKALSRIWVQTEGRGRAEGPKDTQHQGAGGGRDPQVLRLGEEGRPEQMWSWQGSPKAVPTVMSS